MKFNSTFMPSPAPPVSGFSLMIRGTFEIKTHWCAKAAFWALLDASARACAWVAEAEAEAKDKGAAAYAWRSCALGDAFAEAGAMAVVSCAFCWGGLDDVVGAALKAAPVTRVQRDEESEDKMSWAFIEVVFDGVLLFWVFDGVGGGFEGSRRGLGGMANAAVLLVG